MVDDEAARERLEAEARALRRLERERGLLQKAIALGAIVPVASGLYGVLFGSSLTGDALSASGESHYRYLSGLLLAIGLAFWSTAPNIEATGPRFRLLTLLVFIGGLARLFGAASPHLPPLWVLGALAMELFVTPILCLWQWRVARSYMVEEKKAATPRPTAPPAVRPAPPAAVLPEDVPEPVPATPARAVFADPRTP